MGKNTTTVLDECTQLCETPFRTVFQYTVRALRTDRDKAPPLVMVFVPWAYLLRAVVLALSTLSMT